MTTPTEENLSAALTDAVQAARAVPAAAVDGAQDRLVRALQGRAPRRARAPRRWAMAGVGAMAALVLAISLPFLLGQGDAFAAVQAHFRDFRTLQMDVVQRHGEQVLITSRIRVDAAGATRTDIGDALSVVVDPAHGRVLTLLHEEHRAVVAAIPAHAAATGKDIAWLAELRRFSGKATALPETRTIAGRTAQGWSLALANGNVEIWADADGLPLEMRTLGGPLQIDYRFTFDVDFAADVLAVAVPAGYAEEAADTD